MLAEQTGHLLVQFADLLVDQPTFLQRHLQQPPIASLNCSGVARKRSSAKAAKAAGLVSPSARAFNIRRALKPSRSETKLDNLIWASSRRDSNWFCNRIRARLNWNFLRVTVRHRRCSASGTKLRVQSLHQAFGIGEIPLASPSSAIGLCLCQMQPSGPPLGTFSLLA